ncbi:MAG: lysophospholipase [Gemmatimonadota bacterium]|nr:lysophospholipase [Gemmatimonadota bacterium]
MIQLVAALVLAAPSPRGIGDSVSSSPVTLKTATGDLAGTEVVPAGVSRPPVVLMIPGSGPTDRDGNSQIQVVPGKTLHTDTYRLLAAALAADGIASVRYDKRGIGASAAAMAGKSENDINFHSGIDDAVAWVSMLRADSRFSNVIIIGHSEGSLIGMVAATRAKADGFVSLEGAGRRASVVLREQLASRGVPAEMYGATLDSLDAGRTVASTAPALAALFRPSVQPYLISWFRYDPAVELRKFSYRSLVIQGSHDIQTSAADAQALASAPGARLVMIDGMTHVLKDGPADAASQFAGVYTDPSLPLDTAAVQAIVAYVRAVPQRR